MNDSQRLVDCIPRLRRYARALLGTRADADDLVQDTVARGWDKLASWRQGSDMRAWLFGIMHNLHVDRLRGQPPASEPLDLALPLAAPGGDAAAARLTLRDLDTALRLLPSEQREVVLLVALEELSYEEVAAVLGIPAGTVMSRLARGRERLRLLMEGQPLPSPLKVIK
ncbi:sigma-70 family RNA polymerase sigma factor [Pseudoduganella sp. FT25W]|uniref:Sigma-70 family RNA polymerase sigma factor n=1 Tax=Duganella alba TaxID=2666081 RepID=A0A6L5QPP2_9BURK|nr:RNA polymerase sigma factor [Duganella alba]MRX11834.1 sigma-70 family RNA polymerase sigma factor [Duganella alba]MRX20203.1 sigma-70 family RNA polymerase sigma factor [Duganella alba]